MLQDSGDFPRDKAKASVFMETSLKWVQRHHATNTLMSNLKWKDQVSWPDQRGKMLLSIPFAPKPFTKWTIGRRKSPIGKQWIKSVCPLAGAAKGQYC